MVYQVTKDQAQDQIVRTPMGSMNDTQNTEEVGFFEKFWDNFTGLFSSDDKEQEKTQAQETVFTKEQGEQKLEEQKQNQVEYVKQQIAAHNEKSGYSFIDTLYREKMADSEKMVYTNDYDIVGRNGKSQLENFLNGKDNKYYSNCSDSVGDYIRYAQSKGILGYSQDEFKKFDLVNPSAANIASVAEKMTEKYGGISLREPESLDANNYKPGMVIYYDTGENAKLGDGVGRVSHIAMIDVDGEGNKIIRNFNGKDDPTDYYGVYDLQKFLDNRNERGFDIKATDLMPQNRARYDAQLTAMAEAKVNGDDERYAQLVDELNNPVLFANKNIDFNLNQKTEMVANGVHNNGSTYIENDFENNYKASVNSMFAANGARPDLSYEYETASNNVPASPSFKHN